MAGQNQIQGSAFPSTAQSVATYALVHVQGITNPIQENSLQHCAGYCEEYQDGIFISQGSSEKQPVGCRERYIREIYFKELAHMIVWAGKPEIYRGGQQFGNSNKS